MSKLYFQEVPEASVVQEHFSRVFPGTDAESVHTYMLIRKFSTNLDISLDAYFSQFNLSVGRFTLMIILTFSPDGLMPSDLSHQVGVTQATISGLINSLEKAGLVTREAHAKDGRAYVIKMTAKGNELIQKISPEYYARVKTFTDSFTPQERVLLNDLLTRGLKSVTALGRSS